MTGTTFLEEGSVVQGLLACVVFRRSSIIKLHFFFKVAFTILNLEIWFYCVRCNCSIRMMTEWLNARVFIPLVRTSNTSRHRTTFGGKRSLELSEQTFISLRTRRQRLNDSISIGVVFLKRLVLKDDRCRNTDSDLLDWMTGFEKSGSLNECARNDVVICSWFCRSQHSRPILVNDGLWEVGILWTSGFVLTS